MALAAAVDGLVVVTGLGFGGQDPRDQLGRHGLVDVDDAAPDLGILQPDGAAHPPQHRVGGIGAVPLVDGLAVAGQDEKRWRLCHSGQRADQPPDAQQREIHLHATRESGRADAGGIAYAAELVAVCDTLVAGRHFPLDTDAFAIGWKALAVNLSDLAAMGAMPQWALLALTLPERGPIGANCLANARDFKAPVAAYEDVQRPGKLYVKWCGDMFVTDVTASPLDVIAWHGNYYPYKYDLRHYSPVGAISFDHPDPSIFTVLTSPSGEVGTANIDFVIFPERWMVAENTFRPPWYHRNIMSEFMGLIYGVYDAKPDGFVPGGMSLHNMMLPHGPDAPAFEKASNEPMVPHKQVGTMAFMLETRLPQRLTAFASTLKSIDEKYLDCWGGLKRRFDPTSKTPKW